MSDAESPEQPPSIAAGPAPWARWGFSLSVLLVAMLGVFGGLGAFTFGYGKGASYLSNDPQSCANCHVMQDHFDSWEKSTHSHVAVCNDCHLPHHSIGKWIVKGDNGFFHSLAFTLGNYPEPLRIKPRNRRVTQGTCLHCHSELVHDALLDETSGEVMQCIHCHQDVGHAER